ncbi:MAG: hypothetical protein ACREO5_03085, partial [Candidatus Binatia bacterium]
MDNIAPEAPRDPSDPLVKAIDRFFDVVIEDPLLKLYFFDTDIGRLKENFVTYLTYLFADKETQYKEKSLLAAHAGRDITDEAAARFSEKL